MSISAPLSVGQWRPFLAEYSREILSSPDQELEQWTPEGIVTVPRFSPEAVAAQWLGQEPADESQIVATEVRLGRPLPPSFRNFYLVSNGWSEAGEFGEDLWPLADLVWLRDSEFAFLIESWADVLDEDIRNAVERALLIGYADGGAGDYWLLSPPASDDYEEWTAYRWSAGSGDAPEPHETFGDLMLVAREEARESSEA